MANKSKAKGTRAETAIVNWLVTQGFEAKRKPLTGALDEGDIEIKGYALIIQSKWTASTPTAGLLDTWLAAAVDQASNASFSSNSDNTFWLPVLVHNRQRCADPAKWIWYAWSARDKAYLRMDGPHFVEWLQRIYESE